MPPTNRDAQPDDPTSPQQRALQHERRANRSTLQQWERFTEHRKELTAQLMPTTPLERELSLCVLGAGNCNDLDLAALSEHYSEIALVDLDADALEAAAARQDPAVRTRLQCHAPVDLTGLLGSLAQWQRFELTPEHVVRLPSLVARQLQERIGKRYDRVVSACVLTQLQLTVLRELGSGHRLFPLATHTVSLTHLRALHALTAAGGRALLATELTANATAPELETADFCTEGSGLAALQQFISAGNVIGVAHPDALRAIAKDDPVLNTRATLHAPHRAWLWQQGPKRVFLTYGMWLDRISHP